MSKRTWFTAWRQAWVRLLFSWGGIAAAGLALPLAAQTDHAIYTDSLQNGWQDWGWATHDYANGSPVHSGSRSVAVTVNSAWVGLQVYHPDLNSGNYSALRFWANGGATGGQRLRVYGLLHIGTTLNDDQDSLDLAPLPRNAWQQYSVPLSAIGVANKPNFTGFVIQDILGATQPTFYLDDIELVANANPPPAVALSSPSAGSIYLAPASISLAADVTANGHTLTRVQFYNGDTLLGEDATAPYTFAWSNVGAGTYSLSARVVYDATNTVDSALVSVTVVASAPVAITVDALRNRRPISPLIYGVAFASSNQLADLNAPLNRSGGNAETRYNWQLNAHNRAADWYFESLPDSPATPGAGADNHVANSRNGGAEPMLTVPMIGWAPRLGPNRGRLASYSIKKYGPQTGNDSQWFPDAGNGVSTTNNTPITWNDPNDANTPVDVAFQRGWLEHLTNRWGPSSAGGVRYYLMDNEHALWHHTHRDVHPVGATMQEVRDRFFEYAGMVKSVDPGALICAPEEWGWTGYFYSGYDLQYGDQHGWGSFPDRAANGNWDYMPWLLDQFRQRAAATGQRLLDYFTLHIYPQGANEFGDDVASATQLARNRSTRALWDTNYVDATWIADVVKLIPRMKSWVATYYPGTKIGITEYNWGAENHINGATAQADLLGIFGREGLDLATRWTTPSASTPTYKAMKLYRNYDGNKSGFGDISIAAAGPNPDNVSVFAAERSKDGTLTILAINKQLLASAPATFTVTNFLPASVAQAWRLTSDNTITRLADISYTGIVFSNTLPPQSITLFVLPKGAPPRLRAELANGTQPELDLWLKGQPRQRYVLQTSTDLAEWLPLQTNFLDATELRLTLPAKNPARFYRARWAP